MPLRREQIAAVLHGLGEKADLRRRFERMTSLDQPQDADAVDMALEMGGSLVPGVGQALAARDFERARRADDKAGMAMAAASAIPVNRLIGALKGFDPVMREINVYHGSPHRFEEFDASKIGTGEGAQAYGHGIYLAESPDVAKDYATRLWKNKYPAGRSEAWAASADFYKAQKKYLQSVLDNAPKETKEALKNQMDVALEGIEKAKREVGPQFYTADLPDEMVDRMLDWDKPLSEQPESVRKAVQQINAEFAVPYAKLDEPLGFYVGKLGDAVGGHANASKLMASYGVPGIRYLDAGSRGQGGTGTRNFVVFPGEEKKVKILKRE